MRLRGIDGSRENGESHLTSCHFGGSRHAVLVCSIRRAFIGGLLGTIPTGTTHAGTPRRDSAHHGTRG
jgi:hypothetical protein